MARKCRAEVEGGLYHVMSRGNNRRRIFSAPSDYDKFLTLLARQKDRLPFFLYAYALMPNHFHLLIERQADSIGEIMHRLLTGYSNYYNRRHSRVGHLFRERYKPILCQSDRYLTELVRYIHLNPVRAGLVAMPEQYQYSGHRAYLGLAPAGILDVDPVLRHFGAKKALARAAYRQFVLVPLGHGRPNDFYPADEARVLGSQEFVDATIHRLGEIKGKGQRTAKVNVEFNGDRLIEAVAQICDISRSELCGSGKSAATVTAKELLVMIGREMGASLKTLADISGLSPSAVSRRNDAAKLKLRENGEMSKLAVAIRQAYRQRK